MTESGKPHSPSIVTSDPEKVEETIIERVHNDVRSEDYEHHYEDHGQASVLTAYFNVVCVVAGTGTLGLPKAFAEGGWLGIMILLLSYAMAVYSGVVLIRCLYYKQGQRLHDIKAVGTAAFGTCGYLIASVLHFFNLFGCPALYLVLAGGNMHQLLSSTVSLASSIFSSIEPLFFPCFCTIMHVSSSSQSHFFNDLVCRSDAG